MQCQFLLLCDVLLGTNGTDTTDDLFDGLHVAEDYLLIICGFLDLQFLTHDALTVLTLVESLPQFLCDEWHEGVQHFQQDIEEAQCCIVGLTVDRLGLAIDIGRLYHLEIPTGELVPEQFIDSHQRLGDTILREMIIQFRIGFLEFGFKPGYSKFGSASLIDICYLPSLHQTEGVPDLIVEVTSLLAECFVEENVVAGRCREHHTHTHAVSTKLLDEFDRIG